MTNLDFARNLEREVDALASEEGHEQGLGAAFTEYMFAVLTDAGEIDDGTVAIYEVRGARASGYSVSEDESTVFIFVSDFEPSGVLRRLGKVDIESHFRRLRTFLERAIDGLWRQLEESSPAWDMANRIEEVWPRIADVRLVLITNAEARGAIPEPVAVRGIGVTHHVWDLDRLYKLRSSGQLHEPITVDFEDYIGTPLPVLGPKGKEGEYEAFLTVIPGALLARIYDDYGPRLLELNVRSFLQARNKVNKGIQETLRSDPGRFLAYNNGISVTATNVELSELPTGGLGMRRINGLQIVNGGQTTASLHYSKTKNKTDLTDVFVQAKISVVDESCLDAIVPKISEFANSQNKVNMADFSANDPFHVEIEKLSRSVWAPSRDGSHNMTRWFYERARGQYADALAREIGAPKQRQFRSAHPLAQKFTKTDLAKFENTWDQLPFLVSLGAEKNFREFTLRLGNRSSFRPDVSYFQGLVAKALLFRTAEKVIGSMRLGGYRAQTVTYSISLILFRTGQRLDLGSIWNRQCLSDELISDIEEVGRLAHKRIVDSAGKSNIGEWAKKPNCWEAVKDLDWGPSSSLVDQLTKGSSAGIGRGSSVSEVLSDQESEAMSRVRAVSPDDWFAISKWAKEANALAPWQRSLAFSLGRLISNDRPPSRKQAIQGEIILDEAMRLGLKITSSSGS